MACNEASSSLQPLADAAVRGRRPPRTADSGHSGSQPQPVSSKKWTMPFGHGNFIALHSSGS